MGRPQPQQDYNRHLENDWEYSMEDDVDFDEPRSMPIQKWDDELDEFLDDYDDLNGVDMPNVDDDL